MGVSTDGQLNYGIVFDEGFEFPWSERDDVEDWWREVNGYENPNFDPYDGKGGYKPGVTRDDPRVTAYHLHRREWMAAHPIPIELVNYCSGDYPCWMLALPELKWCASRGCPERIDPAALVVTDEQRNSLIEFCKKYGIEHDAPPAWYLTSYWG